MNRTDPTFKQQSQMNEEDLSFIDDLFDSLFASLTDNDDISSDTDAIPDFRKVPN
jgi:hypothetical protein